jgi:hypothetical protein
VRGGRYGKSTPSKSRVVHYTGGGIFVRGPKMRTYVSGYPLCHIPAGRVTGTDEPEDVTCLKCQAFLKKWRKK